MPANHLHFELWGLSIFTKFSKNLDASILISDLFLYDYVLNQWKVLSLIEMSKQKQLNTSYDYFSQINEKDIKRKTQIEMITRSSMRRSTIRSSQHYSRMKTPKQVQDDDTESFKSLAIDIGGEDRSEKSSIFRESLYMDAYGYENDTDLWSINLQKQHFSVIPILVLENKERSTESGISKAVHNFFEANNDVIGDLFEKEDKDTKRLRNWDEDEIRLNDSDNEFEDVKDSNPDRCAITVEVSQKSKQNSSLSLIQINAKICEINLQITPFTIQNLCYLLNPIEYFYSSSLDEDLDNFKQFVQDTLNSNLVVEPSLQNNQPAGNTM